MSPFQRMCPHYPHPLSRYACSLINPRSVDSINQPAGPGFHAFSLTLARSERRLTLPILRVPLYTHRVPRVKAPNKKSAYSEDCLRTFPVTDAMIDLLSLEDPAARKIAIEDYRDDSSISSIRPPISQDGWSTQSPHLHRALNTQSPTTESLLPSPSTSPMLTPFFPF